MEHERWSRSYKDFTAFQLERAQEDCQTAEDQLKSAEEYMCSIIDTIRCLGFTVEFIDSHTAAVVKIDDSMFYFLYSNLLITNLLIRNPYSLSVRFCYFFDPWLTRVYFAKFFCRTITNINLPAPFSLFWQILTYQGRRMNSCHK